MKNLATALVLLAAASCASTTEATQVVPYDLETCIVMESELGSMGDPIVLVYEGQEVKFCCEPCVDEFESNPDFYIARLEEKRAAKADR